MENKLEQLLNNLIEKGWKPFGEGCHRSPYKRVSIHKNYNKERTYALFYSNNHSHWKVLRQVVSKESGLWQFVCENGMVKKRGEYRAKRRHLHGWEHDGDVYHDTSYTKNDYEYFIIESALCDENKLEEFLLENIKL